MPSEEGFDEARIGESNGTCRAIIVYCEAEELCASRAHLYVIHVRERIDGMIKVSGAVVADAEVVDDEAKRYFTGGVVEIAGSGRFVIPSGEEVGG